MHLSAGWLAFIDLNRLTLAGIIGAVWLTLRGFLATLDTAGEFARPVKTRVGNVRRPVLNADEAEFTGPVKP